MRSELKLNDNELLIFHESRKRRILVGILSFRKDVAKYVFHYTDQYKKSKKAIPLSPQLDLFANRHVSKKNELFPFFLDRIPLRSNPAYEDYCLSQNITPDEKNPIILLGTIGKRGPSSFVFELEYTSDFTRNNLIKFRESLEISQNDFANAFNLSIATVQRIEEGSSSDLNTFKLIEIYLTFPEVALWQLKQSGINVHSKVLANMTRYFYELKNMGNKS